MAWSKVLRFNRKGTCVALLVQTFICFGCWGREFSPGVKVWHGLTPPVVLTGNGRHNQQAGNKQEKAHGRETQPRIQKGNN